MSIEYWSDNIVLVTLGAEPQLGEELQMAAAIAADKKGCDIVVDFAEVDILTSSSIAKLLKLRKALKDTDRHMVLSAVGLRTKNVLVVTGLENVFDFVDDKTVALAGLQLSI